MKSIETDIEKISKKLEEEGCRVLTEEELRLKVNGGWGKSSSGGSSSSTRNSGSGSHGGSGGSRNSSKGSSGSSGTAKNNSGSSKKSGSGGTTKTSFGQKVSNVVNSIKSWAQAHAPTNKIDTGYGSSGKNNNDSIGSSQQYTSGVGSSKTREIENTNHAVANARPGDTITRNNGTRITLKQSDIDYAKAHDTTPAMTSISKQPASEGNNRNASIRFDYSRKNTAIKKENGITRNGVSQKTIYLDEVKVSKQNQTNIVKETQPSIKNEKQTDISNHITPKITPVYDYEGKFVGYGDAAQRVADAREKERAFYFQFEGRAKKNVITESYNDIKRSIENNDGNWIKLDYKQSLFHQNGIGNVEEKYICKDGREAVFTSDFSQDGSYELYLDPKYAGTYNYCNPCIPTKSPSNITEWMSLCTKDIGHFALDMLPYFVTGGRNVRDCAEIVGVSDK